MKVISLSPPWGLLICKNLKDCENRDWRSVFTGEILIHHSLKWDNDAMRTIHDVDFHSWAWLTDQYVPTGAIIGKATFGKQVDYLDSKWFLGRFAWPCSNGVLFEKPIPCKGHLGLWDWEVPESLQWIIKE